MNLPAHPVPLTAREALARHIPGLTEMLSVAAEEVRGWSGWSDERTLSRAGILEGRLLRLPFPSFALVVRGHRRRAAAECKDQRVRRIEPYRKGPEMAAIVEREYVLKK